MRLFALRSVPPGYPHFTNLPLLSRGQFASFGFAHSANKRIPASNTTDVQIRGFSLLSLVVL